MHSFTARYVAVAASLIAAAKALNGIVVPDSIRANTAFNATFLDQNSDTYRVYLAAALGGGNGPTCYLVNSTDLSSPVSLTIPASVGPSADYYSIAMSDLTSGQGATYSNRFNFTGGTGNYTEYETHLDGAPFWSPDDLPCSSYECARQCAQASYPNDLTETSAYTTMKNCILKCPGVSNAANLTEPAHTNSTASKSAMEALITLGSGKVLTAMETVVTTGSKTMTEAVMGSMTITLGGAKATVSSEAVSMASNGIAVGGSTTVVFSTTAVDNAVSGTATSASASATSSGAASRQEMAMAGVAGVAGLAALLL